MARADESRDAGRSETFDEKMDRNWGELLQELRVLQTGVQILAGFLLTLPFQSRFEKLDGFEIGLYLCNVVLAALTTALILLPVSAHRRLFRQGLKEVLVSSADRIAKTALAAVALLSVGTSAGFRRHDRADRRDRGRRGAPGGPAGAAGPGAGPASAEGPGAQHREWP